MIPDGMMVHIGMVWILHYLIMEKIFRDSMDSVTNHSTEDFQLSKQDRVPTQKVLVRA